MSVSMIEICVVEHPHNGYVVCFMLVLTFMTLTLMTMSLVGDTFNTHVYSIQYLSNLLLNIVTDVELTTSCGKLFQILTTRRLEKFFRRSSRER